MCAAAASARARHLSAIIVATLSESTAREPAAVTSQGVRELVLCAVKMGPDSCSISRRAKARPDTSARMKTSSSRTRSSVSMQRGAAE
eukprot:2681834-Prymnesium_polylepis.1